MKKILLSLACLLICLPIAGCATTSDASILSSLNNQLDRVQNIVSSTSSTEVNTVSPYTEITSQNPMSMYKAEAYSNMTNEETLRQKVLSLNSQLKNSQKTYKLGKYRAGSINSLTNNLSKYLNYLNNTKSEVKNNVNKITQISNAKIHNPESIYSSYVALSNVMNERYIYLENLYYTLTKIQDILEQATPLQTSDKEENAENKNTEECQDKENCNTNTHTATKSYTPRMRFQSNIDTYYYNKLPKRENIASNNQGVNNYQQTPITTAPITNPYNNNLTYPYPAQYFPYGGAYNFGFGRFNPFRNTDSFYPYLINIDTFRLPPNSSQSQLGGGINNPLTAPVLQNPNPTLENEVESEKLDEQSTENLQTIDEKSTLDNESVLDERKIVEDNLDEVGNSNFSRLPKDNHDLSFSITNNKQDKEKRHVI